MTISAKLTRKLAVVLLLGQAATLGLTSVASAEWKEDSSPCDVGPGAVLPPPVRGFPVGEAVDTPTGYFSYGEPSGEDPPLSDFTASADWGDGEVTPATVTAGTVSDCMVVSTSKHAYRAPGNYPFSYTVHDAKTGLDHMLAATEFHIWSIVPQLVGDPASRTISATVGVPWSGVVAEFHYESGDMLFTYGAEIEWGDGGPATPATITGQNDSFTVSGSFTYAHPLSGTIDVLLSRLQQPLGRWPVSGVTVTAPPGTAPHASSPRTIRLRGKPILAILPRAVELIFATDVRLSVSGPARNAAVILHGRPSPVGPLFPRRSTSCYMANVGIPSRRLDGHPRYPFSLSIESGQPASDRGRATAHRFASLARARAFAARHLGCR